MKHITPAMKQSFKKHIDQLLELKVIRPSKSRHRTTAFIVNSGTYIDPVTKEEAYRSIAGIKGDTAKQKQTPNKT